jgi:hypothetical protein
MGHYTTIYGQINGISEESFELIREDLMAIFENVYWSPDRSGALEIDSYGKHCPEFVGPVFDKIAFALDKGTYGELTISDEEAASVIFFAGSSEGKPHGQWIEEQVKTLRPENPFKGDGKDLYGLRLEEINREHEYSYDLLLRAATDSEAWEKAQEHAMHWYDDAGRELKKAQGYQEYYFLGREIIVRIVQVYKTTKEEWLERQYQSALIDSEPA